MDTRGECDNFVTMSHTHNDAVLKRGVGKSLQLCVFSLLFLSHFLSLKRLCQYIQIEYRFMELASIHYRVNGSAVSMAHMWLSFHDSV